MSQKLDSMASLDFGPPRRCYSVDAYEKEIDRQESLRDAGYLRRDCGQTWAWSSGETTDARTVWHWTTSFSVYLSNDHDRFTDYEEAWAETASARARANR